MSFVPCAIIIITKGGGLDKTISELIEEIVSTHHAYVRKALSLILHELDGLSKTHRDDTDWQRLHEDFMALRNELEIHLAKEEAMVFPSFKHLEACEKGEAVLDLKKHDIRESLNQMEYEHDATAEYLDAIETDMSQIGPSSENQNLFGQLKALQADLTEHIKKEEYLLFPAARSVYYTLTQNLMREE